MHDRAKENRTGRKRRHARVRRKSFGTSERPRLAVFRSTQHMNAQIINDAEGKTLLAVTTASKEFLKQAKKSNKMERSTLLGKLL
ncbi:MAG: 50S ribosomal protein L18, partial [Gemmatimonadetes bacterium]|nr:50S ribosomal protein L18 [Gemmatimonadota bacterium]